MKQYIQILDLLSDDVNDEFMITIYENQKKEKTLL